MDKNNVISLDNRELVEGSLTGLIPNRVRQLIVLEVEVEVNELFAKYDGQHTETGLQAVVRKRLIV